jgi:outer membrane protein assembly factor BamD
MGNRQASTDAATARTILALLVATVAAALFACAGRQKLTADETFLGANEHFDSGAYELAISGYKKLLDEYPFTEQSEEAEMKIAQAYYLLGRYAEAITAFSDFERMHPTSPKVPRVTYYLGMSYLKQMRPIDRDQSASGNAHAYFRAVLDRYPGSPWAERARLRLRECEEALAAHELYVSEFYLRDKKLLAAESRLTHLLRTYPNTDAAARALHLLGTTYLERDLREPAALAFLALIAHHADHPLADQATAELVRLQGAPMGNGSAPTADPLGLLIAHLTAADGRQPEPGSSVSAGRDSSSQHSGGAAADLREPEPVY